MILLEIWNDGSGDTAFGNYDIKLWMPHEYVEARVEHFDRSLGAIALLREAVDQLEAKRGLPV